MVQIAETLGVIHIVDAKTVIHLGVNVEASLCACRELEIAAQRLHYGKRNGEAVGVNILSDGNNCFGLTSNELKVIADNIIGGKGLNKLFLDIKGTYISKMENYTKSNLGISIEELNGFYVSFVRFNSLGFELGLKNGDIIKSINGIEIKTSRDYYNAIYTSVADVSIEVIRNGEILTLTGVVND